MVQSLSVRSLIAVALLFAAAACASPVGLSRTTGAASSLSAADRNFVAQAAYGSLAEITLGRTAERQAGSAEVREFGRMMVADHARMTQELVDLATDKGMAPPTAPDPGRQAVAEMLGELSGPAFDRQYVPQQIAEHEVALTLFQREAQSGQDPDVRAFAARHAPTVEQHLTMLRQLETRIVAAR